MKKVFYFMIGKEDKVQIFYGTSNPGKFADVKKLVEKTEPRIGLEQFAVDLRELQTVDQREIAIDKGRQAWAMLKKPVFVDDSGLYLEKYHEFPGVLSKFVIQGLGVEGFKRLFNEGDRAYYKITLVFFYEEEQFLVFERKGLGSLTLKNTLPVSATLPYDAFFVPEGASMTLMQLRLAGCFDGFDNRMLIIKDLIEWLERNHFLIP